jgi:hypothetical protein
MLTVFREALTYDIRYIKHKTRIDKPVFTIML